MPCAKFGWNCQFFSSAISILSSLGKGRDPSFEQTWIPFTQGWFMPSLVEIGSEENDF